MLNKKRILNFFKENFNLFVIIILFIVLCVSYILTIPVFEAPDECGHFLYSYYIAKYNKIPREYNEPIPSKQYIEENIDKNADKVFYTDEKYMFYEEPGYLIYRDQRHHPPTYYLISAMILKPFLNDNIFIERKLSREQGLYNRFINNKILINKSPTISMALVLRLSQIIYGILIIIFIFKIIKLVTNNDFKNHSVILISGIAFLPQFVFLCSYINNDILSILFGLISVYFILLLFKTNKAYLGFISVFFAVMGGFTKYSVLIMIPITMLAFFIWFILRRKKIWGILGIVIIILIFAGFLIWIMNINSTSSALLNKMSGVINRFLDNWKESKNNLINTQALAVTFKSTVAVFGWMNIFVSNNIYNLFLIYVISGIAIFFDKVKNYKENKNQIIFIIVSIITIFTYFVIYSSQGNWIQNQGRIIFLAVILAYILVIIGFNSLKFKFKNILYYSLFSASISINLFCLYNYIYLNYYT